MTQRNTVQRRQVLQAVQQLENHPTAEEVYDFLCRQQAGIGRATVYRNLHVLCGQGLIRRVPVAGAPDRFDRTLQPHYHLHCRCCGAFADLFLPMPARLDQLVARETGFADVAHDIVFSGVCGDCQARQVAKTP